MSSERMKELEKAFSEPSYPPNPPDGLCTVCKKQPGAWSKDPYANDVYDNPDAVMFTCSDCYHERLMDI